MLEKLKKQLDKFCTTGLASIAGMVWRMGGSGNYSRYWRRAGVALLLVLNCFIKTKSWFSLIVFPTSFGPFTLGYGLPSPTDPKPSALGKFWSKFIKNEFWLRVAVRASCGLAYSMNYLVLGILLSHYIRMGIAMLLLTILIPTIVV